MDSSDHERLRDLLVNTKHKFLLTYDNCTEVRELYSDVSHLHFFETGWKYTTGIATTDEESLEKYLLATFVPGITTTRLLDRKVI